jgi:hypothetical protein
VNRNARLRSGIVVGATGTTTLDIDLPTVTVSGSFKIAGAAVADPQDYGQLELRDDFGDTVELGKTSDLTYSVKVVPGSYDLYYSIQRGGTIAPVNSSTRLRCFNVSR